MSQRFYDRLWMFATATCIVLLTVVGCGELQRLQEIATTPGPDGVAPADDLLTGIIGVVANPLNVPAWVKISGAVATIVAGYVVARKVAPTVTPTPTTIWQKLVAVLSTLKTFLKR